MSTTGVTDNESFGTYGKEADVKDEESLGSEPQHLGEKFAEEVSAMDRIETNFRLVMMSVKELELATRGTAEDVKAIAASVETMKTSLGRQTDAVVNLATTMELALETLREVLDEQDGIKRRLSALEENAQRIATMEKDLEELKKRS